MNALVVKVRAAISSRAKKLMQLAPLTKLRLHTHKHLEPTFRLALILNDVAWRKMGDLIGGSEVEKWHFSSDKRQTNAHSKASASSLATCKGKNFPPLCVCVQKMFALTRGILLCEFFPLLGGVSRPLAIRSHAWACHRAPINPAGV